MKRAQFADDIHLVFHGIGQAVFGIESGLAMGGLASQLRAVEAGAASTANRAGTLTKIGEDAWQSSGGLKYVGLDKNGLNRVEHVLRHTVPEGAGHSVFSAPRNKILGLLDEAYASAGRVPVVGDPAAFITPMGRTVGTAGENAVRLIMRPGTSEIISAYPIKLP